MTRETKLLIDMWDILHRECHKVVTEENYDAIKKSIKALEQEDILDKIRAELHATAEMHEDGDYYLRDEWIDEYFDKYKVEGEVKE